MSIKPGEALQATETYINAQGLTPLDETCALPLLAVVCSDLDSSHRLEKIGMGRYQVRLLLLCGCASNRCCSDPADMD